VFPSQRGYLFKVLSGKIKKEELYIRKIVISDDLKDIHFNDYYSFFTWILSLVQ